MALLESNILCVKKSIQICHINIIEKGMDVEERKCANCHRIFSTRSSLVRHLSRKSVCESNRLRYENMTLPRNRKNLFTTNTLTDSIDLSESMIFRPKDNATNVIVTGGNVLIGDVIQNTIHVTTKIEWKDIDR
jgi:hypothetical protein